MKLADIPVVVNEAMPEGMAIVGDRDAALADAARAQFLRDQRLIDEVARRSSPRPYVIIIGIAS